MHPQIHSPNSIAVLDETTLYITNDHYFLARYHPWLAKLETWLAPPSGNVIHFDILTETATHLDRVAFANGVVLLDDKTLAVASTTKAEVYVYHAPNNGVSRGSDIKPKLYLKKTIPIPFLPDNLSFNTHTGKLLIAGHAHPFSMDPFAKSRDACHSGKGETQKKACQIRTSTGVAEWSEEAGLKVLWMGDEFATGSTAVRDGKRGMGIVSGLFERGLLVWRE
jgi:arylesterase/paraoxonase